MQLLQPTGSKMLDYLMKFLGKLLANHALFIASFIRCFSRFCLKLGEGNAILITGV